MRARGGLELLRHGGGELGDVADRDPPAIAEPLGQLADIDEVEVLGIGAEIEMHVDVDVELARHLEHAVDLAVRIWCRCRARRRPPCRRA